MLNENVRFAAMRHGVKLWQIAMEIGISEPTLYRWLRFPLPAEKEARVLEAIEKLSEAKEE